MEIRITELKDIETIKELLNKSSFSNKDISKAFDNSMVVYEKGNLIGYSSYIDLKDKENTALIDCIFIVEEFRGQYIGDGLVRSILNLMKSRGISKVYTISNNKTNEFLDKLGFNQVNNDLSQDVKTIKFIYDNIKENNKLYEVSLQEYFNKPCRSSL